MNPILGSGIDFKGALRVDPLLLARSRLLLTANSGGGKTHALRSLAESTYGVLPHIILDLDDELYTLRERHDYVLASNDGGDCPAEARHAAMLARMCLELNISIIVGLFELKPHDKQVFVRDFLTALIKAPKKLWGPRLVFIDEVHIFCPEKGKGSALAHEAVVRLFDQGRKRGLGAVASTHRLAKFDKDAAAECNNLMIGRMRLTADRKRAGEDFGFDKQETEAFKTLQPGQFFFTGPAFNIDAVGLAQVRRAKTTHAEPGDPVAPVPAASNKVQKALSKLAELPERSRQEIEDLQQAKAEITQLRRENTALKNSHVDPKILEEKEALIRHARDLQKSLEAKPKNVPILTAEDRKLLRKIAETWSKTEQALQKGQNWLQAGTEVTKLVADILRSADEALKPTNVIVTRPPTSLTNRYQAEKPNKSQPPRSSPSAPGGDLKGASVTMLTYLAALGGQATWKQLCSLAGVARKKSTFRNYRSMLKVGGYVIEDEGDQAVLTTLGSEYLTNNGIEVPALDYVGVREMWLEELKGGARDMLAYLIELYPAAVSWRAVSDACGVDRSKSTFRNYRSILKSNELVVEDGERVRVTPELMGDR